MRKNEFKISFLVFFYRPMLIKSTINLNQPKLIDQ